MLWPEGEDKELGEIKGIGSPLWKMGKIGRGCVIKEVESWRHLWSLATNWGATFFKKEGKCCCKQCRERKGQNQQLWKKKMRVEYGLNKTGGWKATKACELVCFLHFVLYFTVFPWYQVRSGCLLLSAPYVGCKCAGLFFDNCPACSTRGVTSTSMNICNTSLSLAGLVRMWAAPSSVLGVNFSPAFQEFREWFLNPIADLCFSP